MLPKLEPWQEDLIRRIERGGRFTYLMPRKGGMRRMLQEVVERHKQMEGE